VSSFKTESIAQNDLARFRALGYPGIIVAVEVPGRGIWRRVVLGPYDSPSEAEAMATAVRAAGLSEKAQAMRLKPE
jgi:cell division septation protein DedD